MCVGHNSGKGVLMLTQSPHIKFFFEPVPIKSDIAMSVVSHVGTFQVDNRKVSLSTAFTNANEYNLWYECLPIVRSHLCGFT